MSLNDESTAKFEIELVDKQIQKIKQAKKDCQTHYGKQLGCGTCRALQLCMWVDKLVDIIETLREHSKTLQKENDGWQKRYYELDAGHSRLFKDFCKLQQKIKQLRTQVAKTKEALTIANKYMPDVGHFCTCGKCKKCGTDINYAGYGYCLKCARDIIDTALSDTSKSKEGGKTKWH